MDSLVFVFGSNLAGRHGAGAALTARSMYGARYGQGEGRQGMSYAVPTKDEYLRTLPLERIEEHVRVFLAYAEAQPETRFLVTRVGCGRAGYSDADMAPRFRDAPPNCILPVQWHAFAARAVTFHDEGRILWSLSKMPRVFNRNMEEVPANAVHVGRRGKWGNPVSHLERSLAVVKVGSREEAIRGHERWFIWQASLLAALPELRGRDLECYCKPQACHGDFLLVLANAPEDLFYPLIVAARHAASLPAAQGHAYLEKVAHPVIFRILGRVIEARPEHAVLRGGA